MASQTRSYQSSESAFPELLRATEEWLRSEEFKCQVLKTETGGILIQIEQEGGWRKLTGMSTALNIVFTQQPDSLNVEIGEGRWVDKVAGGTVGMLLLWPLAITTAIGAWNQSQMPNKIFQFVESYLRRNTQSAPSPAPAPAPSEDDLIAKLEKLAALKERGILTEEEFQTQKQKILGE
jgi:hypothetical protein